MPKKIMVVDDDPDIVDYLVSLFEDNGYLTCSASDGNTALELAKAQQPDLLTLDVEMPDEWGPRFYHRLADEEGFTDIPVVVISGLPGADMALRRAVATLKKPFDPEQLIQIVRKTLGE